MNTPTTAIIGWGHTKFGKHSDRSLESLINEAVAQAIAHGSIACNEIDEIFLGHFNAGLSEQDFTASLVLQYPEMPRFTPVTRVENACATGSAAFKAGCSAVAADRSKTVLVVGVEKMTHLSNPDVGAVLGRAGFVCEEAHLGGSVGLFADIAARYVERYGNADEAFAHIAVKNHANGMANPLAHLQKTLSYEFCRHPSDKNPVVAPPLKRSDCSLVSDGAAAVILRSSDNLDGCKQAVAVKGMVQVNDYLPMSRRDMTELAGCRQAWQQLLTQTGLSIWDLDLIELHDCFTIAELMQYEAMGLTEPGQGLKALQEGWVYRDGKLPINVSGGLKSKGHPIGATGVSMLVMAANQLTGNAGQMQLPQANLAGVFNMGGTGVANYASILERLR